MYSKSSYIFLCWLILLSCNNSNDDFLCQKIEEIKQFGNVNPDSALVLLQDLQEPIYNSNEHTKNIFELVKIRLDDKAFNIPVSDKGIKKVLEYFANNGTCEEKQEAYYYAASVYRDLDDAPRSLEYFLKSLEWSEQCEGADSVMLRNSYSQLSALYFSVQDYTNALRMAKNETEIAKKLNILDSRTLLHEGSAFLRLDSLSEAKQCLMSALKYLENDKNNIDANTLSSILYQLSSFGYKEDAYKCYQYVIDIQKDYDLPATMYLSLGKYYSLVEQVDSAIKCYSTITDKTSDLEYKYDAFRHLSIIYNNQGDIKNANYYAQQFIAVSDSINLGKRQTEAATINNRFKYQKDKEEEQRIKEEKERYYIVLLVSSFSFVVIVLVLISFFTYKKNLRLKEIIEKTHELKRVKGENRILQNEILQQENNLLTAKAKLRKNDEELRKMRENLDLSETELQFAKNQLEERLLQSKSILQLLHQTKFEGSAEDMIEKIRMAADGRYKMKELDWKRFHNAVNELYPDFADRILTHSKKKISDKQLLFCQLIRVGITNPQIQVLLDMPKATVWRWANKYSWILDEDNSTEIIE